MIFNLDSLPRVETPERDLEPKTVLHVFGMKRSGHHAVMQWIQAGLSADGVGVQHLNNVFDKYQAAGERHDMSAPDIESKISNAAATIISYEDLSYTDRWTIPSYADPLVNIKNPLRFGDIIIIRDFYNMIASRLQRLHNLDQIGRRAAIHNVDWLTVKAVWSEYAALALSFESGDPLSPTVINYNDWFSDNDYREQLAAILGISNSTESLGTVPEFGKGSSFDGLALNGLARQMNVLNRWQQLSPELAQKFRQIVDDPNIASLNQALFGYGTDVAQISARLCQEEI